MTIKVGSAFASGESFALRKTTVDGRFSSRLTVPDITICDTACGASFYRKAISVAVTTAPMTPIAAAIAPAAVAGIGSSLPRRSALIVAV
jgi:hypothetical protein